MSHEAPDATPPLTPEGVNLEIVPPTQDQIDQLHDIATEIDDAYVKLLGVSYVGFASLQRVLGTDSYGRRLQVKRIPLTSLEDTQRMISARGPSSAENSFNPSLTFYRFGEGADGKVTLEVERGRLFDGVTFVDLSQAEGDEHAGELLTHAVDWQLREMQFGPEPWDDPASSAGPRTDGGSAAEVVRLDASLRALWVTRRIEIGAFLLDTPE